MKGLTEIEMMVLLFRAPIMKHDCPWAHSVFFCDSLRLQEFILQGRVFQSGPECRCPRGHEFRDLRFRFCQPKSHVGENRLGQDDEICLNQQQKPAD